MSWRRTQVLISKISKLVMYSGVINIRLGGCDCATQVLVGCTKSTPGRPLQKWSKIESERSAEMYGETHNCSSKDNGDPS